MFFLQLPMRQTLPVSKWRTFQAEIAAHSLSLLSYTYGFNPHWEVLTIFWVGVGIRLRANVLAVWTVKAPGTLMHPWDSDCDSAQGQMAEEEAAGWVTQPQRLP